MPLNGCRPAGLAAAWVLLLACAPVSFLSSAETARKPGETGAVQSPRLLPAAFTALIRTDPALVEYWSFNQDILGSQKKLALKTVRQDANFQAGPFEDAKSLDLAPGQAAFSEPSAILDSPKLSIELIFTVPAYPKRESGEGCLLGIRNGKDARFSVHYKTGSYYLSLWDGKNTTSYVTDFCLQMNQWYHLAVAISDSAATIWLNGKPCRAATERGFGKDAKNLPLVLGANDVAGTGEHAGIRVSHLALYNNLLTENAVASRIKALGWPDPGQPNEAQLVDKRIDEFTKKHQLNVYWKFNPDFIPPNYRGQMKAAQASVAQANMIIGLYERMCKVWPREVTKHIRGIYVFDWAEMMGVRGVCMAEARSVYMSSNLPEYVLWPRCFHECSHVVIEAVDFDRNRWNALLPKDARYISWEATKGNPFETSPKLYEQGFLVKYSQINADEDFAVFSDYVFCNAKELKERMAQYPEIRKKATFVIEYFRKLSKDLDLSAYDSVLEPKAVEAPDRPKANP